MCDKELPQLQANKSSAVGQRHKWQRLNQSLWHQRHVLSAEIKKNTHSFIHIYNQLKLTANPYLLC